MRDVGEIADGSRDKEKGSRHADIIKDKGPGAEPRPLAGYTSGLQSGSQVWVNTEGMEFVSTNRCCDRFDCDCCGHDANRRRGRGRSHRIQNRRRC